VKVGKEQLFEIFNDTDKYSKVYKVKAESSPFDFVRWNANTNLVSESVAIHK